MAAAKELAAGGGGDPEAFQRGEEGFDFDEFAEKEMENDQEIVFPQLVLLAEAFDCELAAAGGEAKPLAREDPGVAGSLVRLRGTLGGVVIAGGKFEKGLRALKAEVAPPVEVPEEFLFVGVGLRVRPGGGRPGGGEEKGEAPRVGEERGFKRVDPPRSSIHEQPPAFPEWGGRAQGFEGSRSREPGAVGHGDDFSSVEAVHGSLGAAVEQEGKDQEFQNPQVLRIPLSAERGESLQRLAAQVSKAVPGEGGVRAGGPTRLVLRDGPKLVTEFENSFEGLGVAVHEWSEGV